jgi:hypothetical protein
MLRPPRMAMAIIAITPLLALLSGCGGGGRITTFPADGVPTASAARITVRITEAVRRPDELELVLRIDNPTSDSATFARNYGVFTAATLVQGDIRITGKRTPTRARTLPPNQYTVLAGEEASLRLVFRNAAIDRATNATLHLVGSTLGVGQTWTIPIPPEPSRPVTTASNP